MDKEQQATAHHHSDHLDSFGPLDQEHPPAGGGGGGAAMVDYMLGQAHHPVAAPSSQPTTQQVSASSFDKLSFSDVLQFADFGPKLALNQPALSDGREDDDDDDDSYFFRFQSLPTAPPPQQQQHVEQEGSKTTAADGGTTHDVGGGGAAISETTTTLVQQADGGRGADHKGGGDQGNKSGRRKRPRTVKTSEEVESQRMTHIAVERNRRRQMNEYLRVLRSLMPGSYVQRGDQASIIGGAIEFIRELEQLIQCLESQKRRRLYGGSGDAPRPGADAAGGGAGAPAAASIQQPQPQPPTFFPPSLPFPTTASGGSASEGAPKILVDLDVASGGGLREEVAENKSCLADIEVRALGPDAMIKILSRRRPGQLIKTIAALEEMQMTILHTNITTIEQTVLYSFNVKIAGDATFSAEDIAGAVHQILSFIDINYTM